MLQLFCIKNEEGGGIMKVLHVVRQFKPSIGGMENFVDSLTIHLKKLGIESDILTLDKEFSTGDRLPAFSCENGIKVIRIPYVGSRKYPVALSSITYLSDYDLIHIHAVDFFIDYFAMLKAFHKKPIVLSTHGGFFHTKTFAQFKKIYFQTVTRFSLHQANRIVACSNNDYDLFYPIGKRKVQLIENGIDFETFHSVVDSEKKKNKFIFIGRFSNNKRIDKLLRLFALLKEDQPDISLSIVGKDYDHLKNTFHKLIKDYQLERHVIIKESLSKEELLKEVGTSEYFISASEYEGFGMSTLEAMSAGAIPILNNIPSFSKMIEEAKNGYLMDFNDISSVMDKVTDIISSTDQDKQLLKKTAIDTARRYSWMSVVGQFEKVYSDTVKKKVVHI